MVKGRINTIETGRTDEGPGIRLVIFTQGCPLRCLYCPHPDIIDPLGGYETTVEELVFEIKKYAPYMDFPEGGVTVSGGEPLAQAEFTEELIKECRQMGIHTALSTSGHIDIDGAKTAIEYADLVILSLKSFNRQIYSRLTGAEPEPALELAGYLSKIKKETRIRFVLVPGLTDEKENLEGLARFIAGLGEAVKVEILPFEKIGEYRWNEAGISCPLANNTPLATGEDVEKAAAIFRKYNLSLLTED